MPPTSVHIPRPERFGRYTLQGLLGDGATASVYRALRDDGTPAALKIHDERRTGRASDPADAFVRESACLSRIDHPNVVRIVEHGLVDGRAFVAMDLVDGVPLARLLEDGPLDPTRAVRLIAQAARGLAAAHGQGVLHRDVKPANLLVDDLDHLVVVDFGLAKEFGDGVSMTGDGLLLGTPESMAPEQIRGRPLDARCDVYGLGTVLYTALTGRPPFAQRQTAALLMAHLNDPVPPLAITAPHVDWPRTAEEIVQRCLAKSRGARFASMDDLVAALELLQQVLDDPTADDTLVRRVSSPPRTAPLVEQKPPAVLPLALVAVVVVCFGYVLFQGLTAVTSPAARVPVVTTPAPPAPEEPAPIAGPPVDPTPYEPLITADLPPLAPLARPPVIRVTPPPDPSPEPEPARPRDLRRSDLKNPFPSLENR
jgi:serine/threonine-protein kinase